MKFTKRHLIAIAAVLANSRAQNKYEVAQDLAQMFQEDNPNFNYQKFFRAIGITMAQLPNKPIVNSDGTPAIIRHKYGED